MDLDSNNLIYYTILTFSVALKAQEWPPYTNIASQQGTILHLQSIVLLSVELLQLLETVFNVLLVIGQHFNHHSNVSFDVFAFLVDLLASDFKLLLSRVQQGTALHEFVLCLLFDGACFVLEGADLRLLQARLAFQTLALTAVQQLSVLQLGLKSLVRVALVLVGLLQGSQFVLQIHLLELTGLELGAQSGQE